MAHYTKSVPVSETLFGTCRRTQHLRQIAGRCAFVRKLPPYNIAEFPTKIKASERANRQLPIATVCHGFALLKDFPRKDP